MCTVTYLPLGDNDFILTSNRDESPMRKTIHPTEYIENGVKLLYPKDELAGGTWIGLSEKKRLVCLLNGGFEKHQRGQYYKMSRGIIVKSLLTSDNAVDFVTDFDFNGVEPFTIVLVDWNNQLKTYELVWDGAKKHFTELAQEPKIWSSSSLYDYEMKQLRKEWFSEWLKEQESFQQEKIINFHKDETKGNSKISLKMKRTFVETVSISSIKKEKEELTFCYLDFINDNNVSIVQKKLGQL